MISKLWRGRLSERFSQIPRELKLFFLKAFIGLVVWKVAYLWFLSSILDPRLTFYTTKGTWLLSKWFISKETTFISWWGHDNLYINESPVLMIANPCNALELMVLYVGFIFCIPAPVLRKIGFLSGGVLIIYLANVARCLLLVYLSRNYVHLFDFAHKYIFTTLVYAVIFLMWMNYLKKGDHESKLEKA